MNFALVTNKINRKCGSHLKNCKAQLTRSENQFKNTLRKERTI